MDQATETAGLGFDAGEGESEKGLESESGRGEEGRRGGVTDFCIINHSALLNEILFELAVEW